MKKLVCWLMAAAASVAFAENAATYHALSWSVPGSAINAFDARYVNVYAEDAGGNRLPGGDGRDGQVTADVSLATTSIVQGDEGWGLTSEQVQGAKFRVELLGASMGAVAVSDPVDYAALVAAGAFSVNYESSGVPLNGDTPYAFGDFAPTAKDGGVYDKLKSIFGDNATVVPEVDANGDYVNYTVKLLANLNGPIELPGNLGKVTIDLNGHEIAGQPAANGSGKQGGNAIEIVAGTLTPGAGATQLVVMNSKAADDYTRGSIVGGKGADGATGERGGYAIKVAEGVSGVTVDVRSGIVRGGASGASAGGAPTAGIAAVSGAAVTGEAPAGEAGVGLASWAWTKTSYVPGVDLTPTGTTLAADGTLYIWKVNSTSSFECATFDFDELAGKMADGEVHFAGGEIFVDGITATEAAGDLTFVGSADGTVLSSCLLNPTFDVVSAADQVRCWTNLTFTGPVCDGAADGNNGGIVVDGGAIRVCGCTFTNCVSAGVGGAVCAERLAADSVIADCRFADNAAPGLWGAGGAVCVGAKQGVEVVLSVVGTTFERNFANETGGAICNVEKANDLFDQDPVRLDVADCAFADNEAGWQGGAIASDGDVLVDSLATWDDRGTTVFARNFAGWSGGAISIDGVEGDDNFADVRIGRGVVFACNVVSNANGLAEGGAVDLFLTNCTFAAEGAAFVSNVVWGAGALYADEDWGAYGGAVNAYDGSVAFDACVFDANAVHGVSGTYYFGAGVVVADGGLTLLNSTFRNQNVDAVTAFGGTVGVTNCVVVGNFAGTGEPKAADEYCAGEIADMILDGANVSMAYSAWGSISPYAHVTAVDSNNLSNRTVEIYADGELGAGTLRLRSTGFNPVAALGVVQVGARDFDGVLYGSKEIGSSMGAFETVTEPVVVSIDADKTYNGNSSSNGIDWAQATWTLTRTNGEEIAWADLVPAGGSLTDVLAVTNWWYGAKDAGFYASSNAAPANVVANVEGVGAKKSEIDWWIERNVLQLVYTGTIGRRPVEMGGLEVVAAPEEYRYTGSNVWATVVVTDTLPEGGEPLVRDNSDYALLCTNNVGPTAEAVANVTLLRNYIGETNVNYWITAYLVEYKYDGVTDEAATRTVGELHDVFVEVGEIPQTVAKDGKTYAFDHDYAPTNGVVRKVDDAGGILRLQVLYCIDRNGDGTPDKYQRELIAKVVNGTWNAAQVGGDPKLWATLWGADGKWSTTGKGTIDDSGLIPAAGANAMGGFSAGGWLAFNADGNLVEVTPATFEVRNTTAPFLIYAYRHGVATTGGSGRGHGGSRPGTGTGTAPATSLADQYKSGVKIVGCDFRGGAVTLRANVTITDLQGASANSTVLDEPVRDAAIKLWAVEKLGQPWERIEGAYADGEGNVVIPLSSDDRMPSCFFKVGL